MDGLVLTHTKMIKHGFLVSLPHHCGAIWSHTHPSTISFFVDGASVIPLWVHRGRSGLLTLPEAACQELSQLAWSQNLCHICHWIHWTPHLVRLRRWIWRSWLGHPCCWELRSDQLQQWSSAESMNDMNITEPFNKSTFQHVIGMWILWMWQEKVRENQLQFAQVGTTAPTAAVAALTMARPLRCCLGMWGVCVYHTITATYGPNIFAGAKISQTKNLFILRLHMLQCIHLWRLRLLHEV